MLCLAALGCGAEGSGAAPAGARARVLRIHAASSLTEAFGALARDFEAAHPGVEVRATFAGSQALRVQLMQGAPADLFASANQAHMRALQRAGVVDASQPFARSQLALIVPTDNPAGITAFAQLPRARRLVVGADNVPVGAYTDALLERAERVLGQAFTRAVRARIVSREANVRLVRAKVALGEADAAIVYRSDALSEPAVRVVEIPPAFNVSADYPVGVLRGAEEPELAAAFVLSLRSAAGHRILAEHGFSPLR